MNNNNQQNLHTVEEPLALFSTYTTTKPFLKWAGGKTQLLIELHKHIPFHYNKYIEPFIGGGALFFSINPENAVISDANEELINTYQQVKTNVEQVISHLRTFQNKEDFYYKIRGLNPNQLKDSYRAARIIYLNKTCFNGLYRVNKQGTFNVPYGKGSASFLNEEKLWSASQALQSTTIIHNDYLAVLSTYAEKGDFVFLDPPYYPVGKFSDFKRYTKEFFYHEDQVRLRDEIVRLVNLGCKVISTNSDHEIILDLYSDFPIHIIETKRLISSNSKTRTGKDVIIIGGYEK